MNNSFRTHLSQQLDEIRAAGTYKRERVINTPQGTTIRVADGKAVLLETATGLTDGVPAGFIWSVVSAGQSKLEAI